MSRTHTHGRQKQAGRQLPHENKTVRDVHFRLVGQLRTARAARTKWSPSTTGRCLRHRGVCPVRHKGPQLFKLPDTSMSSCSIVSHALLSCTGVHSTGLKVTISDVQRASPVAKKWIGNLSLHTHSSNALRCNHGSNALFCI